MTNSPDIRFERNGNLGVVVLDRQPALNALTHAMVQALSLQLVAWKDDPEIAAVLVKAVPGRAFCAGGDIKVVTELGRSEGVDAAARFFHDEYRLNWRIFAYPKPYIAFLDGVTMGGGVGISVHGLHRVLTERTVFAMPETGIGFFPDVGGTHFLPLCPGEIGMYLALTGARLEAADCLHAGVGTHRVASADLPGLEETLAEVRPEPDAAEEIAAILDEAGQKPTEPAPLEAIRGRIDSCFAGVTLAEIVGRLEDEPTGWGRQQLATIREKSPFATHVTFRQLRMGRGLDMAEAMKLEWRLANRFLAGHDFYEGVRALVIDKDKRPRWQHAGLEEVRAVEVDACFALLPQGDLPLDWEGV